MSSSSIKYVLQSTFNFKPANRQSHLELPISMFFKKWSKIYMRLYRICMHEDKKYMYTYSSWLCLPHRSMTRSHHHMQSAPRLNVFRSMVLVDEISGKKQHWFHWYELLQIIHLSYESFKAFFRLVSWFWWCFINLNRLLCNVFWAVMVHVQYYVVYAPS